MTVKDARGYFSRIVNAIRTKINENIKSHRKAFTHYTESKSLRAAALAVLLEELDSQSIMDNTNVFAKETVALIRNFYEATESSGYEHKQELRDAVHNPFMLAVEIVRQVRAKWKEHRPAELRTLMFSLAADFAQHLTAISEGLEAIYQDFKAFNASPQFTALCKTSHAHIDAAAAQKRYHEINGTQRASKTTSTANGVGKKRKRKSSASETAEAVEADDDNDASSDDCGSHGTEEGDDDEMTEELANFIASDNDAEEDGDDGDDGENSDDDTSERDDDNADQAGAGDDDDDGEDEHANPDNLKIEAMEKGLLLQKDAPVHRVGRHRLRVRSANVLTALEVNRALVEAENAQLAEIKRQLKAQRQQQNGVSGAATLNGEHVAGEDEEDEDDDDDEEEEDPDDAEFAPSEEE